MVLKAPFSSLQRRVPLLARPLASDDVYNNISKIPKLSMPVLIIHDKNDPVIPVGHSRRIKAASKNNVTLTEVDYPSQNPHIISNKVTIDIMDQWQQEATKKPRTSPIRKENSTYWQEHTRKQENPIPTSRESKL